MMDKDCLLNGNWNGFYEYGKGYPEKIKGKKVFFETAIGQNKGRFIGRVKEQNEIGEIEYISIKGTFVDNKIIFMKQHTKVYLIDEHQNINPEAISKNIILYYRGEFYSAENKFKGEWEDTETGTISLQGGGTWEMWKAQ